MVGNTWYVEFEEPLVCRLYVFVLAQAGRDLSMQLRKIEVGRTMKDTAPMRSQLVLQLVCASMQQL